mmetsp:Transcript_1934/g.3428  ORF Transcript_1934/g.3428 Transcript_1934/m.3428 type:complete len:320 (-) Transcript_1934:341-1300(-)
MAITSFVCSPGAPALKTNRVSSFSCRVPSASTRTAKRSKLLFMGAEASASYVSQAEAAKNADIQRLREERKIQVFSLIEDIRRATGQWGNDPAPITLVKIKDPKKKKEWEEKIDVALRDLEKLTPCPKPLIDNPMILDGKWKLIYSDASEITSLAKLPFGFKLRQVNQNINVATTSFMNVAQVMHPWFGVGLKVQVDAKFAIGTTVKMPSMKTNPNAIGKNKLGGMGVNQTERERAAFRAAEEAIRGKRVNVQFLTRTVFLIKLCWGLIRFKIPKMLTKKDIVDRGTPPSLLIEYIDDGMRIGRGGKGSIFVLVRDNAE